jgi:hypothetical protein
MVTAGAIHLQLYSAYVHDPESARPRQFVDIMPPCSINVNAVGQITQPIGLLENPETQKELPTWRLFQVQIQQFIQKKVTVHKITFISTILSNCY